MSAALPSSFANLPGGEYVAEGLADLESGNESISALLLAIASSRLTDAGLRLPARRIPDPELRLYRLLRTFHGDDAHSQYNAHLRRLSSLCHAIESRPALKGALPSNGTAP